MIRKIIKIDEEKCNGCGACASACHEGAIGMVDGKARLLREDYCDGLGDCLPACPVNAISFEEREAPAYDEQAVKLAMAKKNNAYFSGCPGSRTRLFDRKTKAIFSESKASENALNSNKIQESMLSQWPVQIKLVPINAPYFDGANLLIAADCTAFAYGKFHNDFIRDRITLIGCPKLDEGDYAEKLSHIISENNIKSITVARMEVPCCGGLENAVKRAIKSSGKPVPVSVATISTDGRILDR